MKWRPFQIWLPVPKWSWPRFRLSSYFFAIGLLVLGFAWQQDRQRLLKEISALRPPNAKWDTSQATGPPNTFGYGDYRTAWASKSADGAKEWLLLEFPAEVTPAAIVVHETYNPGAIVKATHVDDRGTEKTLWQGTDPTPRSLAGGISRLAVSKPKPVKKIKLYLDSANVPGWNEIDAVGLQTADGNVIWASKAVASSSYGFNPKSLGEAVAAPAATPPMRFGNVVLMR